MSTSLQNRTVLTGVSLAVDGGEALIGPITTSGVRSVGEGSGQPEPGEHGVLEAGQRADPIAGKGEDEQAGAVPDPVRSPDVRAKGRLTIRSGRDEGEPAPRCEDAGEEPSDRYGPLVLEGHWRHGCEDVVGEQAHEGIDVGGPVGTDELRDECFLRR